LLLTAAFKGGKTRAIVEGWMCAVEAHDRQDGQVGRRIAKSARILEAAERPE
jgi:hypothetical protein